MEADRTELSNDEVLAKGAAHSDEEVLRDIEQTEREVESCRKVAQGWELIADHHLDAQQRQLAHFRVGGAWADVERGQRLLVYLKRLAHLRGIGPSLVEEIMAREG
jgi:hypothetical protein